MRFEWDDAKRHTNIAKHGVDFLDAPKMFEGPMLVAPDTRKKYGESRQIGFGFMQGRLMAVVFTERGSDTIRIISIRKANQRETAQYQKALEDQLGKN